MRQFSKLRYEGGSLEQRNEIFNDYLQSGVEVRYFDGKEERNEIVRLLDFNHPENNVFQVVNNGLLSNIQRSALI